MYLLVSDYLLSLLTSSTSFITLNNPNPNPNPNPNRYNTACTRIKDFLKPALDLYTTYMDKGYKLRLIDIYFSKFLRHYKPDLNANAVRHRYLVENTRRVPFRPNPRRKRQQV